MKKKTARTRSARSKAVVAAPIGAAFDEIVELIRTARQQAAPAVNTGLIELYGNVGGSLHRRIESEGWGKGTVALLAEHIVKREPGLRGSSAQNLWRMRHFFVACRDDPKLSPLLRRLQWTHNLIVLAQAKEGEFYLRMAAQTRGGLRSRAAA